jgi:aspartate dehydrogenase
LLSEIVTPFLKAKKQVVVLSVGALLFHPELIEAAKTQGGVIHVPTGALIGLDAMIAAAEGTIHTVRMVTRKPPNGLAGAPHLIENKISIEGLTEAKKVFEGNARDAAKGFPANLNVVVALALAGVGPEKTLLEIWADPGVVRNTHTIVVDSDSAKFTMTMENIPSENPKTGRIVAQSVIALLRKMQSGFKVGT